MKKEYKKIVYEILMGYGFDNNYITFSYYKYDLFLRCVEDGEDFDSICDDMNLHFDRDEEIALFAILEMEGYEVRQFTNYYFYKNKLKK